MDLTSTDTALGHLTAARDLLGDEIAFLAVQAIAQLTREAEPRIATVRLAWDHEGEAAFLTPAGFHDAGGDLSWRGGVRLPGGWPDAADPEESLTSRLRGYCARLDETNSGTWTVFTTQFLDGEVLAEGDERLYVSLALSLADPVSRPPTVAAADEPGIIDARHIAQGHACPAAWEYAELNDGGHEVFACGRGHHLIAVHPAPGHQPGECTDACARAGTRDGQRDR